MAKVMVFGTFDIFHPGHISFLKQAGKYGNFLIVIVARDKTVRNVKGKMPENNESIRLLTIKKSKLANRVELGSLKDKYFAIKKYKPDIICLGYDQKAFIDKLRTKLKKLDLLHTRIIRMKPHKPSAYKSSKLNFFKKRSAAIL